jgi:hypothetical protein
MPRLHTFGGSLTAMLGMRDGNVGALGFLSADDSRNSYAFTSDITSYMYYNDHFSDNKNKLTFVIN